MLCVTFFSSSAVQTLSGVSASREESSPAALLPWERVLRHRARRKTASNLFSEWCRICCSAALASRLRCQSLQYSIKQLLYFWLLASGRPHNLRAGLFVC